MRDTEQNPVTDTGDQDVWVDCGRCVVRSWREGDEPSIVHHADNYEVWRRMWDSFPRPYTHEDAEQWISFTRQNPQTHFAIEVHGEAVGGIGLELGNDIEHRSAEIGYWLREDFWGRGIVTAAVTDLTRYGFETFDLTRIFAVPFREQFRLDTRSGEMRLRPGRDHAPECD